MNETPTPEARAAAWHRLVALAATIRDEDTRAEMLAHWRTRYEREVSGAAREMRERLLQRADDGEYLWHEPESDSAAKLIAIVRELLRLRAERADLGARLRDVQSMAKAIGFVPAVLTRVVRAIEADPAAREEAEAIEATYRATLGVRGPMTEALLPNVTLLPPASSGAARRLTRVEALLEARDG